MPKDTTKRLTAFIQENLKKKFGEIDNITPVVKSWLSDLLHEGMRTQRYILDEPQFEVAVHRVSDPEFLKADISAKNQEAANYLCWLYSQIPGMFTSPPTTYIRFEFVINPKEKTMEKNGNTFVPGDKVRTVSAGKTASSRGVGEVRPESSEGRVKVAWEDGTESWEKPEDLNRG